MLTVLLSACAQGPSPQAEEVLDEEGEVEARVAPLLPSSGVAYADTRYPIVLVGGAFAFDQVLFVDYWFAISERLREAGAEVYVTDLSSAQSNEVRCEELFEDVERILALTGAPKVNLIAHSQGAIAARYVAGVWPEAVASVTSVHGMNQGAHAAEELMEAFPEHGLLFPIANIASAFLFSGLELLASFGRDGGYESPTRVLTPQTLAKLAKAANRKAYPAFNARFPAGMPAQDCMKVGDGLDGDQGFQGKERENGVLYYSWMGTGLYTGGFDPFDQVMWRFFGFFLPRGYVYDGLVPQCGANLGKVIRNDYPLNHGDAINQLLGSTPLDVPTLYVKHANFLQNQGV